MESFFDNLVSLIWRYILVVPQLRIFQYLGAEYGNGPMALQQITYIGMMIIL